MKSLFVVAILLFSAQAFSENLAILNTLFPEPSADAVAYVLSGTNLEGRDCAVVVAYSKDLGFWSLGAVNNGLYTAVPADGMSSPYLKSEGSYFQNMMLITDPRDGKPSGEHIQVTKNTPTLLVMKGTFGQLTIKNGYSEQTAQEAIDSGNFFIQFVDLGPNDHDAGRNLSMTCEIKKFNEAGIK